MIDNIEPPAFAITMLIIGLAMIVLALADRARMQRTDRDIERATARVVPILYEGGCAHVWHDGRSHVCTRRYEHDGPHLDSLDQALLR